MKREEIRKHTKNRMRIKNRRESWSHFLIFIALLLLVSFILNAIWEYLHYPLYICDWERVSCALVAAIYDALITLGIYGAGVLIFKDWFWYPSMRAGDEKYRFWSYLSHLYVFLSSFLVAYGIELRALLTDRWSYAAAMPIIPVLNVGLSPIAQLLILVPLSLYLAAIVASVVSEKLVSRVTP